MSYYNLISLMPKTPAVDPDAQAFITAAAITDPTQQSAINQLVVDLKGYSIWSKMKALYPFVGGSSTSNSYNLRNTAQYQLSFSGGATHNSNGYTSGVNGYANTGLNPNTAFSTNDSMHLSLYSRTNNDLGGLDFGGLNASAVTGLYARFSNNAYAYINGGSGVLTGNTNSTGFYVGTRTASNVLKLFKSGTQLGSTYTGANGARLDLNAFLGALNVSGTAQYYTQRNYAFASIGDGLTDAEALNFYTAVQAFQTTLGRSIGTQTVSDADAQAFVTAADIQDQVEANAINNLVIGMKADGLWTKMKAVYPFVGGTSTSTSYNLKNTAQYQITWNGGITHSSTGVLPNGTNGYGSTGFFFDSTTALSSHISTYIRTNSTTLACEIGSGNSSGSDECFIVRNGSTYLNNQCSGQAQRINPSVADARGLILNSRRANNDWETYKNGSSLGTNTANNTYTGGSSYILNLFRRGGIGTNDLYSAKETAFASIGDGLTDTEAANLYTAVQAFQTALNRNV